MGRAPCCTKVGLKRGPWTAEEDTLLTKYIEEHGEGNWRNLPKGAGLLRCGKSCRLRWINYLRPDVKRGNISEDEEELIIKLHSLLGNRWALIAGRIPGRTDNEIKNYWNTHLRKKLASKDMNPNTQKPIHLGFHTVLRDSGSNDCSTPKCCSSEKKLPQLKTESEDKTNESNLSTQDKSDHHGASHLPLCSSVSSECHDTDILSSRSRSNNADTITSQSSAVSASSAISVSDSFPACLPEHSDFSCLEPLFLPSIACMDCELSSGANFSSDNIGSFNAPLPSSDEDTPISVGLYCNNINKVLGFDYAGDNSILTAFFPAANELTSLEQLQNLDFLQEDVEVDNFGDSINWVAANSWELF